MHVGKGPCHLPDVFKDDMMSMSRNREQRESSEQQGDKSDGRQGRREVVSVDGFPEFVRQFVGFHPCLEKSS